MQTTPTLIAAALLASKPARTRATQPASGFVILPAPVLAAAAVDPDTAAAQAAAVAAREQARRERIDRQNAAARARRRRRNTELQRARRAAQRVALDPEERAANRAARLEQQRAERAAFLEDVEWMAVHGETVAGAAARLGVTEKSFQKRLCDADRCARPDLWARLRANEVRPEAVVTYDGSVGGGLLRGIAC